MRKTLGRSFSNGVASRDKKSWRLPFARRENARPRTRQIQRTLSPENLEQRLVLDSTVVFNEIMYHPADEQMPEWIELFNQNQVNMDLSGWSLADGVEYTFPRGTVVRGGGYLIIAADPEAMQAATGVSDALGPFTGRLSNGGERIELRTNSNRVMDALEYDDKDPWPVGPDGSGATLAKRNEHTATDQAANWAHSIEVGGTPGAANFVEPGSFVFTDLLPSGAAARALVPLDPSVGDTWISPTFDDSTWTAGTTGVGYDNARTTSYDGLLGLDLDAPPDGQAPMPMENVNPSVYIRVPFSIDTDLDQFDTFTLRMKYDDGFIAYLNGVEIAHANAPGRDGDNSPLTWFSWATDSHRNQAAVQFVDFDVTDRRDLLVQGENVLAIHGLNVRPRDNDALFLPELVGGTEVKPDAELSVAITEVSPAGDDFWVELFNTGGEAIDLEGFVITTTGETGGEHVLPSQSLAVGDYLVVGAEQLASSPTAGESVFLYTPRKQKLIDAATVGDRLRGRSVRHEGRWMFPSLATPGAENQFQFTDDIVINEIMYHAAPQYATADTPPTFENTTVLPFDANWRYNRSGEDLGPVWFKETYTVDGQTWRSGPGAFGFESSRLAEPIRTEFSNPADNNPRFLTYYFQTEFDVNDLSAVDALQVRHLVDDGAVFYLNGQEALRFNMPGGVTVASTEAERSVRNAELVGPVPIDHQFLRQGTNVLSVEVHLSSPSSNDVVFGVELLTGKEIEPAIPGVPYVESDEEWIELYNRSQTDRIDMSGWTLDNAVEFVFPDGTSIGPGEYLVIAKDPRPLEAKHSATLVPGSVLGPYNRALANDNERIALLDSAGNVADEVHYYDGGRWHGYADGGGSSLELRDPFADNSRPEAWAASDESGVLGRSPWQHYSYTKTVEPLVFDPPINFHEFHMGMLDAGEVLLDNISVIEDPGGANVELLQNGNFESDEVGGPAGKWRIQGTHEDSRVVIDPDNPDNKVLHLIAEARTNYFGNHAETTLANRAEVENGKTYAISFDAKWIAGSPQLHTELYYKDAVRTNIIQMPGLSGTPGAVNSTFEPNIGPTYDGLRHHPANPKSHEPVTITVRADDPQGVSRATLVWSADEGEFSRLPMVLTANGNYSATIPAQSDGTVVQFYVEGIDSLQATSQYPAAGPDSRALYKVDDDFKPDPLRHDFQIIMLPSEARNLHAVTEYIDNDRTGSTVIYRNREIFYDVGTRLKGSMFSRNDQSRAGFNLRFQPDQLFRGVHENITLDRANPQEIQVKHLINQAGLLGGMYDDVVYFRSPAGRGDGPTPLQMARHGNVFLDSQFENGSQGTVYKFEGIRVMTSTVDGRPESLKIYQPIGWVSNFDITDLGDDKELYRWPFLITNNRAKDDFTRMIDMAKAFSLQGQELQDAVAEVLDVDQWMQTFAMMSLAGIGDAYSQGNPHNLSFYQRPSDNKMLAFPWDWDFTFSQGARSGLHGGQNIGKIISLPVYERIFLGHMLNMIDTVFNVDYMSDWLDHYGQMLNTNFMNNRNYIQQRGEFVLSRLPEEVPFAITTGGGEAITTTRSSFDLQGKGWINVREIRLAGSGEKLPMVWTDVDRWQIDFPLAAGENHLQLEAYDAQGELVGTDGIVVVYDPNASVGDVLISEIHYHNEEVPRIGRLEPEEFEFVELYNKSDHTVDLSNWRIAGEIQYVFAEGSTIEPGEAVTILPFETSDAVKKVSLEVLYGISTSSLKLFGPFTGQLVDEGGTLRLERPATQPPADPAMIDYVLADEVLYDNLPPWPTIADGGGSSLSRRSPTALGTHSSAWTAARPSPGSAEFAATPGRGDANGDGTFDVQDVEMVRQAGKYKTGEPATFAEGDWNEDGLFDQRDIVAALQTGRFAP